MLNGIETTDLPTMTPGSGGGKLKREGFGPNWEGFLREGF